jgi:hypothetical protein
MELRDVFPRLRASLDGNDTFVSGGHGIIKTAGATRHAERMNRVPAWVLDDDRIKEFIKSRFPKSDTDREQRRLASRVLRLIHLYYRLGATAAAVAEELDMSLAAVKIRVHTLEKAMSEPLKPSHRPKKVLSIPASSEESNSGTI